MPTIVNDMILEPKAAPPAEGAVKSAGGEKGAGSSPEVERKIEQTLKRKHERALRLCAY